MRVLVRSTFAAVTLAGCVMVEQTSTSDGKPAHSITCSGSSLSWTDCHEKAASVCGARGYMVVSGGQDVGLGVSRIEGDFFRGTAEGRNMVVQCKG